MEYLGKKARKEKHILDTIEEKRSGDTCTQVQCLADLRLPLFCVVELVSLMWCPGFLGFICCVRGVL